jgi:CRISPR-associated endonuclease/helicase Cas3
MGVFMTYDSMFEEATGRAPYPYQRRLALTEGFPVALSAPTGAGKTAAAALAWLYRRRLAAEPIRRATPRRLVFCLPVRSLVRQTANAVETWLAKLDLQERGKGLDRGDRVGVHELMGGDVDGDWYRHPERDAVLVGTQDMLLSRALNRGYAMSRFSWPWEYGLLSNDCLWVFDEVQLMGVGLATGLQLAALRRSLGAFGPTHALFMSATMEVRWLETVDHPAPTSVFTLDASDLDTPELTRRRRANKQLHRAETVLSRADKSASTRLAREILTRHRTGSRTLVVMNTVPRAVEVFAALEKEAAKRGLATALLHSRFRPPDREAALTSATREGFDGVVVSTQVIEAGVDLTSRTLFTEIAPWASLVQRAGRCNRGGEYDDAHVLWVAHEDDDERLAPPYDAGDLTVARERLAGLDSFNPEAIARADVAMPLKEPAHVLRRRDALDLFDTTADLGGADLDVSRFIREGDERDVQVFWRDVEAEKDLPGQGRPARDELCSVPFLELRRWLVTPRRAFRWDVVDGVWRSVRDHEIVPGAVLLLRARDGGYDARRGWTGESGAVLVVRPGAGPEAEPEEAMGDDPLSTLAGTKRWVTLATHATDAKRAAEEIVRALPIPAEIAEVVIRAAQAHDLGKAHEVFQATMLHGYTGGEAGPWAKSGTRARHGRQGFRHELASALAWLERGAEHERDLVAYLLAAHHGKVRLSIRALPRDAAPQDPERLHARGVWHGDALPEVDLGEGVVVPATTLSLEPMRMGRRDDGTPSWMERALALRERFGPFKLAYLEALVRAADVRASMREALP